MKAIIHLELELEIDFDVQKEERTTRHYPGCPAYVEPYQLTYVGLKEKIMLPDRLADEIINDNEENIEQACWDEIAEEQATEAEYRRDAMMDR